MPSLCGCAWGAGCCAGFHALVSAVFAGNRGVEESVSYDITGACRLNTITVILDQGPVGRNGGSLSWIACCIGSAVGVEILWWAISYVGVVGHTIEAGVLAL